MTSSSLLLEPKQLNKYERIAKKIDPNCTLQEWEDWRWQIKNTINDVETFERLSGIKFEGQDRIDILETVEKFPLAITPYYLSLIKVDDYKNDPVFRQAFPSPEELIITDADMLDPLSR